MGNPYIIWAVIFLGVALVLFFCEVFIPSAGIIGIAAASCLVIGIVLLFKVDTTVGLVGALIAILCLPLLFFVAITLWPNTPIGKSLTLNHQTKPEQSLDSTGRMAVSTTGPTAGTKGTALTDLRPVGICLINNQRVECLADAGVIRSGTAIKVVLNDGMQVKVRPDES